MSRIEEIKNRIEQFLALEMELSTATPARVQRIIQKQAAIQEYYYTDVSDLLEEIENLQKYCDALEDTWLHHPKDGNENN